MRAAWLAFFTCLVISVQPLQADYPQNPLAANDSIYVSHQGVYRFNADQAQPLWSSLSGVETFEVVAWKKLILVGSTQGLYALEQQTGQIAWHIEKQRTLFTPSTSDRGFAGSLHGELYAIDLVSGTIHWRSKFPGWIYSPAINAATMQLWTAGQAHRIFKLSAKNGEPLHEIETSQEAVFSPVEMSSDRIAVNLFDGSTVIIATQGAESDTSLKGDSQPTGLHSSRGRIFRSHRDGTLSAFDAESLELEWRKAIVAQDLTLHPAKPGKLLLSDRDRNLILLDIAGNNTGCRIQTSGKWLLPLQISDGGIIYFQKSLQPPGLTLVNTQASCK